MNQNEKKNNLLLKQKIFVKKKIVKKNKIKNLLHKKFFN